MRLTINSTPTTTILFFFNNDDVTNRKLSVTIGSTIRERYKKNTEYYAGDNFRICPEVSFTWAVSLFPKCCAIVQGITFFIAFSNISPAALSCDFELKPHSETLVKTPRKAGTALNRDSIARRNAASICDITLSWKQELLKKKKCFKTGEYKCWLYQNIVLINWFLRNNWDKHEFTMGYLFYVLQQI